MGVKSFITLGPERGSHGPRRGGGRQERRKTERLAQARSRLDSQAGATTFSITTLSITPKSITILSRSKNATFSIALNPFC
jgi:hypothetical protein